MPNIDKIRVDNVDYDINMDIYTTAETRIGTWIDGKPIYRKVLHNPSNLIAETNQIPIDEDIELIVNMYGQCTRDDGYGLKISKAFEGNLDTAWGLFFKDIGYSSHILYIFIGTSLIERLSTLDIVLEYTKITDTVS